MNIIFQSGRYCSVQLMYLHMALIKQSNYLFMVINSEVMKRWYHKLLKPVIHEGRILGLGHTLQYEAKGAQSLSSWVSNLKTGLVTR